MSPIQIVVLVAIGFLFLYQYTPGLLSNPEQLAIRVCAIVAAITVHEFNHALVANMLGDPTPRRMGRLSLNPLRHLDPIGTVLLFIAQFGWGKPVLFNPRNLRINPRLGSALVSFAGPLANVIFAYALVMLTQLQLSQDRLWLTVVRDLVFLNIGLAAFNLIPVPPLDGFGVVHGILPGPIARMLDPLTTYGPIILLALVFLPNVGGPDLIRPMMQPIVGAITNLVLGR